MAAADATPTTPRGWGVDWRSPKTWARLLTGGILLAVLSTALASGAGLAVKATLDVTSDFAFMALQAVLCSIASVPFAGLIRRRWTIPNLDEETRRSIALFASPSDHGIAMAWLCFVSAAATGGAWAAAGWLDLPLMPNYLAALLCVQLVLIHSPVYQEAIVGLCGVDPRTLPKRTAKEIEAAEIRESVSLGVFIAAITVYTPFLAVVAILIFVLWPF